MGCWLPWGSRPRLTICRASGARDKRFVGGWALRPVPCTLYPGGSVQQIVEEAGQPCTVAVVELVEAGANPLHSFR